MQLVIKKSAYNALLSVAIWVESQNTTGAGERWLDKTITEFQTLAKSGVQHAPCQHALLAKYKYLCFPYGDWVVAYRIEKDNFIISRFIWAGRLA